MEKTKWIVAIFFTLISGYLLIQSFTGMIMGNYEAYFYIQMLIGVVLLQIAVFVGIGIEEEKEKKPRKLSFFFFLHLLQMIAVAWEIWLVWIKDIDIIPEIVILVILLSILIWYGQALYKTLDLERYPRLFWTIETGVFYIATFVMLALGGRGALETFFLIGKEVVIFGLVFYQIITWIIGRRFPKAASFLYGIAIVGMLLLHAIMLLWEIAVSGY